MSYAKPIIERETDSFEICFQIAGFIGNVDIDAMTESEKAFALVDRMHGQINNGGFDQYFLNDGLDFSKQCLDALRLIGIPKMASLLDEALSALGVTTDYHPTDEISAKIGSLDTDFYKIEDEPYDQLAEFVRNRTDNFGWQG